MHRRFVLAVALGLLTGSALAQSATDPVETVRAFYAADNISAVRFYAKSLRTLYERDQGEVGRLGFAFHINGQDTEPGFAKSLALAPLSNEGDRAEVRATFRNGGPQELRYNLVREAGAWKIANVRSLKGETWDLVAILSAPLQ
ncbi:hypothetical protein ASF53_21440 [Methylobacterium sp. Leaf123]|uniref:DUF3828 domain-containing protein n=1 Tax=Methylobacterium sp. Leaf123 TaxID=1736264 RepID=UPI0006FF434A|nr:DUF3828 domain-containing protein [Methylobacterium sp. Leaf123]KQQ26163.1 hypothetical protein ASF53_21440 [Methylobacterium sp. Leaf123]